MSRSARSYQKAYSELAGPALSALRGIYGLDDRQFRTVAGLIAETAGRAAERIAARK